MLFDFIGTTLFLASGTLVFLRFEEDLLWITELKSRSTIKDLSFYDSENDKYTETATNPYYNLEIKQKSCGAALLLNALICLMLLFFHALNLAKEKHPSAVSSSVKSVNVNPNAWNNPRREFSRNEDTSNSNRRRDYSRYEDTSRF